jgi:hypothetical protein
MLDGLDPRTALVYRYALMGLSEHCRGDRRFELKTMALRAQLRLAEDEIAEIFAEARGLQARLANELAVPR